jgi:hypothetical protein
VDILDLLTDSLVYKASFGLGHLLH